MRFIKTGLCAFLFSLFLFLSGCSMVGNNIPVGLLYTNIRMPYTANLDNTPAKGIHGSGKNLRIKEPISGYGIYVELDFNLKEFDFDSNAIGDIAKKYGLSKVYYADIEIFSLFFGVWKQKKIHIYGEKSRHPNIEDKTGNDTPI